MNKRDGSEYRRRNWDKFKREDGKSVRGPGLRYSANDAEPVSCSGEHDSVRVAGTPYVQCKTCQLVYSMIMPSRFDKGGAPTLRPAPCCICGETARGRRVTWGGDVYVVCWKHRTREGLLK